MSSKLKAVHNREIEGFTGLIEDRETYEKLKAGEVDFKETCKSKMKSVRIPVDLFYELMELDKNMKSE